METVVLDVDQDTCLIEEIFNVDPESENKTEMEDTAGDDSGSGSDVDQPPEAATTEDRVGETKDNVGVGVAITEDVSVRVESISDQIPEENRIRYTSENDDQNDDESDYDGEGDDDIDDDKNDEPIRVKETIEEIIAEDEKYVSESSEDEFHDVTSKKKDEDDEEVHAQPDKNELQNTLRTLNAKLEDLSTCNDLITKHGAALQRALSELEQLDSSTDLSPKVKAVNERATLFRITSNAMINACHDYLDLATSQGKRWQKMLQYEHEQRLRLEEMVEQLAKQHSNFEKQARKTLTHASRNHNANKGESHQGAGTPFSEEDDDDDDFFDAIDEHSDEQYVYLPKKKKVPTATLR